MLKCEILKCPYYDPSPIVPDDYSGYCGYYNDAADNAEQYCEIGEKDE